MSKKGLVNWFKFLLLCVGLSTIVVYGYLVPYYSSFMLNGIIASKKDYYICLGFLWAGLIPTVVAVVFVWLILDIFRKDRLYNAKNAKYFKMISIIAAIKCGYKFWGNVLLFAMKMNSSDMMLFSLIGCIIDIVIALTTSYSSYQIKKKSEA